MVTITILCKNYKNYYDRKKNPDPKDCYGQIKITYSKHKVNLHKSKLTFICEKCRQMEV